jgi:hypothetical protein
LEWLWFHTQYRAWSSSETSGLLWIEGKPGSGKSTLAKYVRENLKTKLSKDKPCVIVDYFYSFRGARGEIAHGNMLRSILHGILEQDETFFIHFQTEFRKLKNSGSPEWSAASLQSVLSSLACHSVEQQIYLIIDGIDESEENDRSETIEFLCGLCSGSPPSGCIIKIFLTSRPVTELQYQIHELKMHHTIRLQDENMADIPCTQLLSLKAGLS